MSSTKKNVIINFLGGVLPVIIGFIAIPITIRGLGTESFGIMTLAWVVLGYFGLFDLGFAQATVKYASQYLAANEIKKFNSVFWLAVYISLIMGLIGTLLFSSLTSFIIARFLKIPSVLIEDASNTFYILSISLPLVILLSSLKGILAASNKFTLINKIHTPLNILTYLIPCLSLPFHFKLPIVVGLIVILRAVVIIVYLIIIYKLFPTIYKSKKADLEILKNMLSFGGWVTMSNTISPLLVYLDRFVVGSMISMTAVTYYTAPYELIVRTRIFPSAIVETLFPQFSSAMHLEDRDLLVNLYTKALNYLVLIMTFISLFVIFFADLILNAWLGHSLASHSINVFKILSFGVLFNATATLPFFLLQSAGRPDLPAKFHLTELIIFGLLLFYFISKFGIEGAAIAWSIRAFLDAGLLFTSTYKLFPFLYIKSKLWQILVLIMVSLFLITVNLILDKYFYDIYLHFIISVCSLILFLAIGWKCFLQVSEKSLLLSLLGIRTKHV